MKIDPANSESEGPSMRMVIALNTVAVPLLLASQAFFRPRINALEVDLAVTTEVALGYIPLLLLLALLLATLVIKRYASARFWSIWEGVAVVVLGALVGHQILGTWMPFLSGPIELSLIVNEMLLM